MNHSKHLPVRIVLSTLSERARGGIFTLDDAITALGRPRAVTSRRLGAMVRAGWLARVRRGVYSL